jgi:hypothetical protein
MKNVKNMRFSNKARLDYLIKLLLHANPLHTSCSRTFAKVNEDLVQVNAEFGRSVKAIEKYISKLNDYERTGAIFSNIDVYDMEITLDALKMHCDLISGTLKNKELDCERMNKEDEKDEKMQDFNTKTNNLSNSYKPLVKDLKQLVQDLKEDNLELKLEIRELKRIMSTIVRYSEDIKNSYENEIENGIVIGDKKEGGPYNLKYWIEDLLQYAKEVREHIKVYGDDDDNDNDDDYDNDDGDDNNDNDNDDDDNNDDDGDNNNNNDNNNNGMNAISLDKMQKRSFSTLRRSFLTQRSFSTHRSVLRLSHYVDIVIRIGITILCLFIYIVNALIYCLLIQNQAGGCEGYEGILLPF